MRMSAPLRRAAHARPGGQARRFGITAPSEEQVTSLLHRSGVARYTTLVSPLHLKRDDPLKTRASAAIPFDDEEHALRSALKVRPCIGDEHREPFAAPLSISGPCSRITDDRVTELARQRAAGDAGLWRELSLAETAPALLAGEVPTASCWSAIRRRWPTSAGGAVRSLQ